LFNYYFTFYTFEKFVHIQIKDITFDINDKLAETITNSIDKRKEKKGVRVICCDEKKWTMPNCNFKTDISLRAKTISQHLLRRLNYEFCKKIHSITFMKGFQNSSMKSFEKEFDFKFLHIMNFFGWFGVIWNCNASNFFQQFFLGLQCGLCFTDSPMVIFATY